MTPYVFPGIRTDQQLLKNLQDLIANSGGRLQLAKTLDEEWRFRNKRQRYFHINGRAWGKDEELYIKDNYRTESAKNIAEYLGRPVDAVRKKIYRMRENNELNNKIKTNASNRKNL